MVIFHLCCLACISFYVLSLLYFLFPSFPSPCPPPFLLSSTPTLHRSGSSSGTRLDRSVSAASSPATSETPPSLWWFMTSPVSQSLEGPEQGSLYATYREPVTVLQQHCLSQLPQVALLRLQIASESLCPWADLIMNVIAATKQWFWSFALIETQLCRNYSPSFPLLLLHLLLTFAY